MFSKTKSRTFRKRASSSSDSDSDTERKDEELIKLEEIKEIQKLRDRPSGMSAEVLALGKVAPKAEQLVNNDPSKRQTGGMIDMKALKKQKLSEEDMETIGTAFAAETNRRDEDAEMLKYVEEELARRKGKSKHSDSQQKGKVKADVLYAVPEHLQVESKSKKTEDMLSNQMLSGIPEVDLGIEAKISNIEATEEAKANLFRERMRKKDSEISKFVPTNIAVNFVQHNRFNMEENKVTAKKKPEVVPEVRQVRVGDVDSSTMSSSGVNTRKGDKRGTDTEKATDDFHYEKFKKQMRRF